MPSETLRTETESVGLALPGGKLPDSPLRFPARHGLRVAWTGVEDYSPEPPRLGPLTAILGQNGEVAQGQASKRYQEPKYDFLGGKCYLVMSLFPSSLSTPFPRVWE
ncbi:MAG: hypothetical protein WBQ11_04725, partial [Isosphaeraceae bacterium]